MYAFKKETLKVIHVRLTLSYNTVGHSRMISQVQIDRILKKIASL